MFKRKQEEGYSTQKAVKQNEASSPSSITILDYQEYFWFTSNETQESSEQIIPEQPIYSELNLSSIEEDGENILTMPALTSVAYINETSGEMEPSSSLSSPRDSLDGIDFSLLNFEEEAMISGRFVDLSKAI